MPGPDGPPPPPVVQRVRVRYAKRGRARFTSHRDFQRALERAIRRAGVPVAYSAGFTPHPKVSYAGAAATGAASEAEYFEIGLAAPVEPARLVETLTASLPDGLDVLDAVEARTPDFAGRLEASVWQVELPGLAPPAAERALAAFLARDSVPVERMTKDGRRQLDARAALVRASARAGGAAGDPCAIVELVVRHLTPAVRPDDILTGLRQVGLEPPRPPRATRLAQGRLDASGRLADPLAADRGDTPAADGAEATQPG